MDYSDSASIRSIVELREENERLQEIFNFLKMENFEYALKCNRLENILSNIQGVTQNNPKKLVDASEHLYGILKLCKTENIEHVQENTEKSNTPVTTPLPSTSSKYVGCNKAHIVKPHMVNGTILYIPTINLTRVSEQKASQNNENSTLENEAAITGVSTDSEQNEAGPSTEQDLSSDNQISRLEEISDASSSKSPSHSTVLSGTFQEVKIFLNQISPEQRNEESRKSSSSRPSVQHKRHRSSGCDYVTRSRRH